MDYPGSKLTHPIRLGILIVFMAAFFVISPIIILYTAGYRYDWRNGLLKQTGAISIDIEPRDAEVYLDHIKLTKKMPIRLKNVAPKKYNIKITAPNYHDWQKEEEVKSKQTVYIKEVVMIKKNQPRLLIGKQIDYFSLSPDKRYLIYSISDQKMTEVWLYDVRKQTASVILRLPGGEQIKTTWAEKNNYAAISDEKIPHKKLILIDAGNSKRQLDLVGKIKHPIEKYQWKETIEPELFFSIKNKIMSIKPLTQQLFTLSPHQYEDWWMENGQLWTLQYSTTTSRFLIIKDTLGFLSEFAAIDGTDNPARLPMNKNSLQLLTARNNHVLLKKVGLPEMILQTPAKRFYVAGEKFIISKYNNWWLIWTPWELWTYSENEEPRLLNRSGEQLREVVPLDKYNTLSLVWARKATVLFPYYLVSHNLLDNPTNVVAADSDGRVFYFNGKIEDKEGLWELKY